MAFENFDEVAAEALQDNDIRTAAAENGLRRRLGRIFESARQRKGMSIRALARKMGSSLSQVQRVLHEQVGGSLTLRTIVRAADALDLDLTLGAHSRQPTDDERWIEACSAHGWDSFIERANHPLFGVTGFVAQGDVLIYCHMATVKSVEILDEEQAGKMLPPFVRHSKYVTMQIADEQHRMHHIQNVEGVPS